MRESLLGRGATLGSARRTHAIRAFALALAVLLAVGTFLSAVALDRKSVV